MTFDEPTQRMDAMAERRYEHPGRPEHGRPAHDAPTTRLPGPLDLAGATPSTDSDTTEVLSLDELFDGQPTVESGADAAAHTAPATAEAPTWTAMPVVPVHSDPAAREPVTEPARAEKAGPSSDLRARMTNDALTAWDGAVRRTREWWGHGDNAIMLMTGLVAIVLIVVVSVLSR